MKDNGEDKGPMPTIKFTHIEGGYKALEICRSPADYDIHCERMAGSALGQEAMALGEKVIEKSCTIYALKGDIEASKCLLQYYPNIVRIHGTPIVSKWGKPKYGWVN